MPLFLVCSLALTCSLSLAIDARSALAIKVAPLPPRITPPPSPEIRDRFHDSLAKGLAKGGTVMPASEVRTRVASAPDLQLCTTGGCAGRAAALFKVERIVTADIEDVGKTYTIKVTAFDEAGEPLGATVEEHCDICTIKEATRAVERAAEKAAPLLSTKRPTVVAAVTPAEAAPVVARSSSPEEEGPGTLRESRGAARRHEEAARKAAPPPAIAPVEPTPPAASPAVTPVADTHATDDGRRRFPYKPLGIAALSVAGASLIGTIVFSAYAPRDGKINCPDGTNPKLCPNIYSGNTGGAIGLGITTAVLAATGGVLLYLDKRYAKPTTPKVAVAPLRDGFAVAASLEF